MRPSPAFLAQRGRLWCWQCGQHFPPEQAVSMWVKGGKYRTFCSSACRTACPEPPRVRLTRDEVSA